MYNYYNSLLSSEEFEWKELRNAYIGWYNYTPAELYDVYIMTHMMKLNPASGIVFTAMNRGKELTNVKGKVFTVTYNWKYVPAYPPEYNALHYGKQYNSEEDTKFTQGFYYHPEPGDLGAFLQDSILLKCNAAWATIPASLHPLNKRTNLSNSTYLGSVGEFYADATWFFNGGARCLDFNARCSSLFRSRPCSAYRIN